MSEVLRFEIAANTLRSHTDNLSEAIKISIEGLLSDIHCVVQQKPERASSLVEFIEIMSNTSTELVEKFFGFYTNSSDADRQEIRDYLLSESQDDEEEGIPQILVSFFLAAIRDTMKVIEFTVSDMEKSTDQMIQDVESANSVVERMLLSMMDTPTDSIH